MKFSNSRKEIGSLPGLLVRMSTRIAKCAAAWEGSRTGGFQEYAIANPQFTLHLPDAISFETGAASFGLPQGTAAAALFVSLGIPVPSSIERPVIRDDAKIILIHGAYLMESFRTHLV
eukprot:TRINITY_DN7519_c0_g1_i1.p1 TRINITY_DN7519_c0_g1~~TRINITY_DN7519_c0_g1_i1.p1  ORF type:complete len:118 (-),score=14.26 TRINITY_DN7519_c0_g1_i1:413-766(-)